MSEKNIEMMKKLLAKKKMQQTEKPKHRPNNKIGSSSTAINSTKVGGSNNKI